MIVKLFNLIALGLLCSGVVTTTVQAKQTPSTSGYSKHPISVAALPPEAIETLALIKQGGPFPHKRDGITFGNREKKLPKRPRGYYREYTVRTPGVKNRGARRIVAGQQGEYYYTDNHYKSFKRILE